MVSDSKKGIGDTNRSNKIKLTISILCFYAEEMTLRHLRNTVDLLKASSNAFHFDPYLIIRSNTPDADSTKFDAELKKIRASAQFPIVHERSSHNLGFGAGHNANFRMVPGDIFWVLNNDINFPHLNWLANVFHAFHDESVSLVGPGNSLSTISPGIAAGRARAYDWMPSLYAEGSSLFVRSKHFIETGIFDESFEYAYYEDADLSMRTVTRGMNMALVDMPHEHLRSTSASLIPTAVKRTVMELNRSRFLARWGSALERGQVSGAIQIDLRSPQLGPVIAALRPTAHLYEEARSRGNAVDIRFEQPELEFLFGQLMPEAVLQSGGSAPEPRAYDRVASLRDLNFSAPFHMEDLIAAAFGTPDLPAPLDLRRVMDLGPPGNGGRRGKAVVHFRSDRTDFEGLGLPPSVQTEITGHLISRGLDVAVIEDGALSLEDLFALIATAEIFIGVDSGPLHIAQALDVRSFGIFGATHPLARLRPKPGNAAFSHPDLDCLGCYHSLIETGANWCMRRDQACVEKLPLPLLFKQLDDFVGGAAADWSGPMLDLDRLRRRWLMNQICNPSFRNRLLAYDGTAGNIPDMLVQVLGVLEEQSRGSMRRAVESELHAMHEKLVERDRQIEVLLANHERDNKYLMSVISGQEERLNHLSADHSWQTSNDAAEFEEIEFDGDHAEFIGCSAKKNGEAWLIDCRGADPQIHIKRPLYSRLAGMKIRLKLATDTAGEFQIFYRAPTEDTFAEERSIKSPVHRGLNILEMTIPISNAEVILRIDPLNAPGNITLHKAQFANFDHTKESS